jgi:thiamine biosynthesis protein ThiS
MKYVYLKSAWHSPLKLADISHGVGSIGAEMKFGNKARHALWYSRSMTITLNGAAESFDGDSMTVRELLAAKLWSFPLIIVRKNGHLVERSAWDSDWVSDGDVIDAAHLMSGG